MQNNHLEIAYECLSAIGNSFEIESMMGEVVITFFRATKALYVGYYLDDTRNPLVFAGDKTFHKEISLLGDECYKKESDDLLKVVLPLKNGYLILVYVNEQESLDMYEIVCKFTRKINFALSACVGVKDLEDLNEELDDKVRQAVKTIRENEHMMLVQSKNAMLGEMLEMIAHQWRQPITSIGMISNNMLLNFIINEEESVDIEYVKSELEEINAQVNYISNTIEDFRSLFKESKVKVKIRASELIAKSLSIVNRTFVQNSINVQIIDKSEQKSVTTYKNELIQVILNILYNAKDAFETMAIEDKKITIEYMLEDDLIIKIKDNAGGINEEILPNIFEAYFSTKKHNNGTGLGLYMSKVIIERYIGGNISVLSKDSSAEFIIRVPVEIRA